MVRFRTSGLCGSPARCDFDKLARTLRWNRGIFASAGPARVDLVRSSLQIAKIRAGMVVPREKVNFHTSETPKKCISAFFSRFSRHGSCGIATNLSKHCKMFIFAQTFQFVTQLRGTPSAVSIRAHPIKIRNHPTR